MSKDLSTIVITIGRNIGDRPMPATRWSQFIEGIEGTLAIVAEDIYSIGRTKGEWGGYGEDGAVFIGTTLTATLPALRLVLAEYAKMFSQDAIGLIVQPNTDTLVTPTNKEKVNA